MSFMHQINSKRNIVTFLIIVCLITTVIRLFLPPIGTKDILSENSSSAQNHIFKSIQVQSPLKKERLAVIKIEGIIRDSEENGIFRNTTSSAAAEEFIAKATLDDNVKGIIIKINSPGGTVAASQELYKAILRARKKKPVVITMGDIAASGGYYIASAGSIIYANPGTLTGSIGVITSYLNFYDLLTKVGIKGVVIKSGEYKDIGNPTRPLTEGERKILQKLLDDTYDQFITDVAKARTMNKSEVQKIAKGLIYTGKQAKKIGLVDYLGGYYIAVKHAQKLAKEKFPYLRTKYGERDLPIEETWKSSSVFDILLNSINKKSLPEIVSPKIFNTFSYSRFQPLWLIE